MYTDGSCESLSAAIESRKEDNGSQNAQQLELLSNLQFSNASVHKFANGNRILTYFERNLKTSEYHLVRVPLQGENVEVKRFNLKRGDLNVHVAGAAVVEGDGTPVLLTICKFSRSCMSNLISYKTIQKRTELELN